MPARTAHLEAGVAAYRAGVPACRASGLQSWPGACIRYLVLARIFPPDGGQLVPWCPRTLPPPPLSGESARVPRRLCRVWIVRAGLACARVHLALLPGVGLEPSSRPASRSSTSSRCGGSARALGVAWPHGLGGLGRQVLGRRPARDPAPASSWFRPRSPAGRCSALCAGGGRARSSRSDASSPRLACPPAPPGHAGSCRNRGARGCFPRIWDRLRPSLAGLD